MPTISTPPTPVPSYFVECSSQTCTELGWTEQMTDYGDADLCGQSQDSNGDCGGNLDFNGARDFCQDMGGRLCALEEVLRDEARSSQCSYNSQLIWTSTQGTFGGTKG